ncbi:MAG: carboxypeptidase-like regulatory domain-containing protein [Polyangiaceae bacterium]
MNVWPDLAQPISGFVRGASGEVISHPTLSLDDPFVQDAWTWERGRYSWWLSPGVRRVAVSAPGYETQVATLVVSERLSWLGGADMHWDFVLQPRSPQSPTSVRFPPVIDLGGSRSVDATGSVEGRVLVRELAFRSEFLHWLRLVSLSDGTQLQTHDDSGGDFHFDGVPQGNYRLYAVGVETAGRVDVNVERGEVTRPEVPVHLAPEVDGHVRDAKGQPVAFASVVFVDDIGLQVAATTDETGAFNAPALLPGSFSVRVLTSLWGSGAPAQRARTSLRIAKVGHQHFDFVVRREPAVPAG